MALCQAHHLFYTHHPLEWEEFCGGLYIEAKRRALEGQPERAAEALDRLLRIGFDGAPGME